MAKAFAFLPVIVRPLGSGDASCWPSPDPHLPTPSLGTARQLGARIGVRFLCGLSGFLLFGGHPSEWMGDGALVWKELQCQGRDLPALGSFWMNVCSSFLPVCLLELRKQLWLNALETLPNDRINPQGKLASVVKDYINVLKSPSTALWNQSLILFMPRQEGCSWPELGSTREAPFWIPQALLSHPLLLSGTDPSGQLWSSASGVYAAGPGQLDS